MDIISRKYINEGFNSKAYIINDDYILLDGVNQNSYKNYQKYVNVINQISNVKSLNRCLITNRSNISACKCYEKAGGINKVDDEIIYVYDFKEKN